jgi:hypothetical protein
MSMGKREHLTWEKCLAKYPRLCRVLQWCLIASPGEAACCVRDHRDGLAYGGEVVSHSGLTCADRLRQAWRARHWARESYRLRGQRLAS